MRIIAAIILLTVPAMAQDFNFRGISQTESQLAFGGDISEIRIRVGEDESSKSVKGIKQRELLNESEFLKEAYTIKNGVPECVCSTSSSPFVFMSVQLGNADIGDCANQAGASFKVIENGRLKQVATFLNCGVRVTQKGYSADPDLASTIDTTNFARKNELSQFATLEQLRNEIVWLQQTMAPSASSATSKPYKNKKKIDRKKEINLPPDWR